MADIRVDIELKSGEKYSIDNGRIDSLSSLTQSNSDASTIFYGVVSNTGSIDIADVDEEIKNLVEDEKLDYSGVKLDVFANGKQVQSHISGDSGYQDNLLNISLTDDLSNLSTTVYSNPEESNYLSDLTGLELLVKICEKSSPKIDVPSSGSNNLPYTDSDMLNVYEYLNMIKFKDIDLSLDNRNAQELLNHFCNATQLNIFNGDGGNNTVIESRPVISGINTSHNISNKPIFVKKEIIFEEGPSSIFLKNKIKGVNINIPNIVNTSKYIYKFDGNEFSKKGESYLDENSFYNSGLYDEITFPLIPKDFAKSFRDSNDHYWDVGVYEVELDKYVSTTDTISYAYKRGSTLEHTNRVVNVFNPDTDGTYMDYIQRLINDGTLEFNANKGFVCSFLYENISGKYTNHFTLVIGIKESSPIFQILGASPVKFWLTSKTDSNLNIKMKKINDKLFYFGNDTLGLKKNELLDIASNPLLTSTSTISVYGKDVPLYEYVAMNILNDYSRGIKTKTVTIACSSLCYAHNPKLIAKNWSLGEVLNVGDIINLETEKYRDGSYINWKITGREFSFDGEPLLKAELQECKTIERLYNYLEDIKWSRVAEISQSGKAEQYFKVGDEKYIESVGATMVVLGFNHDEKTSGGNAGITFGLKFNSYANGTRYYMQWAESNTGVPYNSNAGGWETSNARKYLNEDFINALPEDLRMSIVAVNKTTGIGGSSGTTKVTSDKIWIPSEIEMTGSATYSASGEGTQYPYFNTAWTNGYKTWQRYYGVLRSPNLSNTSSMIKNPNTGASETSNSTNSYLFVNGFIGAIEPTSSFDQLVCFCI